MAVNAYEITMNVFWIWVPILNGPFTVYRAIQRIWGQTLSHIEFNNGQKWIAYSSQNIVAALYISHLVVITIMCNPVLTTLNSLRVCVCDLHAFWANRSFCFLLTSAKKMKLLVSSNLIAIIFIAQLKSPAETLVRMFRLLVGILNIRTIIFHSHNFVYD